MAKALCRDGYSISPDGQRLSLDGRLAERFRFGSRLWYAGYEALQRAIVDLDPRLCDRLPLSINVEVWNDSLSTPAPLIEAVWERAMYLLNTEVSHAGVVA